MNINRRIYSHIAPAIIEGFLVHVKKTDSPSKKSVVQILLLSEISLLGRVPLLDGVLLVGELICSAAMFVAEVPCRAFQA